MGIGLATALRTARAQAIIDFIDAGVGTNGTLDLYSEGSEQPATGGAISDQTYIGTLTLANPCGTVSNGVITFDTIAEESSADADEDIFFARAKDTDGNFVADITCGITGSGQVIIFNTLTARVGGVIQILSGSLTEGNL
jgi:hypothetical protein